MTMLALVADPPTGMVVVESLWNCDRAPSPNPALGCRGLVNNESTWHAVPRTSTRARRGGVRMARVHVARSVHRRRAGKDSVACDESAWGRRDTLLRGSPPRRRFRTCHSLLMTT